MPVTLLQRYFTVGMGDFSTQKLQFSTLANNFHGLRFLPLGVLTMLQRVPADC